jgi:hypothetical protein
MSLMTGRIAEEMKDREEKRNPLTKVVNTGRFRNLKTVFIITPQYNRPDKFPDINI